MSYTKVTTENAETLIIADAVIAHYTELIEANEVDDIDFDFVVKVDRLIDKGALLIVPGVSSDVPFISGTPRYEINFFASGYWWVRNNATS